MKIITTTLNPAFDIHCYADQFFLNKENLFSITSKQAGGKGINISKALTSYDINNTALIVIPEENGKEFREKLEEDNLTFKEITTSGRIRENITLHTNDKKETRISFNSEEFDDSIIEKLSHEIIKVITEETYITVTGRLPSGINKTKIKILIKALKENGCKIIIDSKSFTIKDLIELKPWLIKPNQEEISEYLSKEISTLEDALKASKHLNSAGIENVIVSMGDHGAVMTSKDVTLKATAPKITPISTIGAGDSMIAGLLAGIYSDYSIENSFRLAVAFGSAACMTEGTMPPNKQTINSLFSQINL